MKNLIVLTFVVACMAADVQLASGTAAFVTELQETMLNKSQVILDGVKSVADAKLGFANSLNEAKAALLKGVNDVKEAKIAAKDAFVRGIHAKKDKIAAAIVAKKDKIAATIAAKKDKIAATIVAKKEAISATIDAVKNKTVSLLSIKIPIKEMVSSMLMGMLNRVQSHIEMKRNLLSTLSKYSTNTSEPAVTT